MIIATQRTDMVRYILSSVCFLLLLTTAVGQTSGKKMLFVIDSFPLLGDPEEWNQVLPEDIADLTVVGNKDTLKLFGWPDLDGIVYIFTKEYRKRPDSLKRIPTLKQMEMKNNEWRLHGNLYSGKYIDYYNNGKIQNEGTLLYGRLHGELIVYFRNGNKKSAANYKNGILNGIATEYYPNGALMQTSEYVGGTYRRTPQTYFVNGQPMYGKNLRKKTRYDTAFTYYSTGKIKKMQLIRNGTPVFDQRENDINYYTTRFNHSINARNTKDANKYFLELYKLDSTSSDTYFLEGMLLAKELRFEKAIASFDKALKLEPLMRESLLQRALTRINKYRSININGVPEHNYAPITVADITSIPDNEQEKICNDLRKAEYVDYSEYHVRQWTSEAILNFCRKRNP